MEKLTEGRSSDVQDKSDPKLSLVVWNTNGQGGGETNRYPDLKGRVYIQVSHYCTRNRTFGDFSPKYFSVNDITSEVNNDLTDTFK